MAAIMVWCGLLLPVAGGALGRGRAPPSTGGPVSSSSLAMMTLPKLLAAKHDGI